MPCKGDELCCDESRHVDFDNLPKPAENGYSSSDDTVSTTNNSTSFEHPIQPTQPLPIQTPSNITKPLTNGHSSHEGPRQIFIERRAHPSGISFESISPLPGEELKRDGITDMANCRVFVSNYRLVIITQNRHGVCSVPLIGIDSVEAFDETLKIICKDGRIFNICAETQEVAMQWYKMVTPIVCGAHKIEDIFTFKFSNSSVKQRPLFVKKTVSSIQNSLQQLHREYANCGFSDDEWKITNVNEEFKVCSSYPQYLIVPKLTTDQELLELKRGRFFDRFPTAVWRCKQSGAVLLRSSQPEISFFGTTPEGDLKLFEAIRNVTVTDKKKKIIVIDARSYGAALANRAKGGGFEGGDAYFGTEVSFMNLPNIHSLRYSFHQLRQLLNSSVESNNYFQSLNTSQWFQYLYNLIISSQRCVDALFDGLSVLVHCSDGWDRTTQIVSLVKVISDPFYRTFEGFERLIIRDWVEFGHKFSDRNGMTGADTNERSPVFMQFLDAVHQLWLKNPDLFEFNQRYLMKLAQHQYSGMFGTFLFNNYWEMLQHNEFCIQSNALSFDKESIDKSNPATLISVFDYLNKQNPTFMNPVYDAKKTSRLVCPKKIWELQIWREVYCLTSAEENVNNPDNICHTAISELSIHGDNPNSDKLSRSQSAASLNSLDQMTNGIHCNGNGSTNHNTSNSTNPTSYISSSYSTVSFMNTARRETFPPWRVNIDVDGLTNVPIPYEDRILELQRQLAKAESNARSSSESSMKQNENHSVVVLRQRVESNDSSMFGFEVWGEELDVGRKKRDSTCSSNVVFEFCSQRNTSDALIPALNEEDLVKCEHCQDDMADENTETASRKNGVSKCSRCTEQVIPRSNSQVVVS